MYFVQHVEEAVLGRSPRRADRERASRSFHGRLLLVDSAEIALRTPRRRGCYGAWDGSRAVDIPEGWGGGRAQPLLDGALDRSSERPERDRATGAESAYLRHPIEIPDGGHWKQ